jgi:ABC-type Fe3+-hydroxamate transport system substrate-binding protein
LVSRLDAGRSELRKVARPFRFACPIWKESWMWCGADTYVSALVSEAGGKNICDELRYPALSVEEVMARSPETIFLPDEPYPFTEDDAASLRPRGVRVVGPFPGHLFTWHGTRTTAGLRFLRDVMLSQTV